MIFTKSKKCVSPSIKNDCDVVWTHVWSGYKLGVIRNKKHTQNFSLQAQKFFYRPLKSLLGDSKKAFFEAFLCLATRKTMFQAKNHPMGVVEGVCSFLWHVYISYGIGHKWGDVINNICHALRIISTVDGHMDVWSQKVPEKQLKHAFWALQTSFSDAWSHYDFHKNEKMCFSFHKKCLWHRMNTCLVWLQTWGHKEQETYSKLFLYMPRNFFTGLWSHCLGAPKKHFLKLFYA